MCNAINEEVWKPIDCYEGQYEDKFEISSLGRVRRSDHYKIRCVETGQIYNTYQDVVDHLLIKYESVRSAVLYNVEICGYHFERVQEEMNED